MRDRAEEFEVRCPLHGSIPFSAAERRIIVGVGGIGLWAATLGDDVDRRGFGQGCRRGNG